MDFGDLPANLSGIGGTQNLTPQGSVFINTVSVREGIRRELTGKLKFDAINVFRRLKVDQVDAGLVAACETFLVNDQSYMAAKKKLQSLVSAASKLSETHLEGETESTDQAGRPLKRREKEMMKPLYTLFDLIGKFCQGNWPSPYDRQWISTVGKKLISEGDTFSFPTINPDFTLCAVTEDTPRYHQIQPPDNITRIWRDRLAFIELKPSPEQRPQTSDPQVVKPIVTQAADYARLHMSSRPFQLYSIGLLIYGSKFCAAIFDRDGVEFSPEYDMWTNLSIFIRVFRRLTCDMTVQEFGQDPTVGIIPKEVAGKCREVAKSLLLRTHKGKKLKDMQAAIDRYPTYSVTMGKGQQIWYTIGFPIWSSLSMLGRGTQVWRVSSSLNPDSSSLFILKSAWRNSQRTSESTIYEQVKGTHPGLAQFVSGNDVVFPGTSNVVTAVALRYSTPHADDVDTSILHRLIIESEGRPLWEHRSTRELLLGVRAALKAHKFLWDQGILHRDISGNNMMLSSDENAPDERKGFLLDVEFARIGYVTQTTTVPINPVKRPDGTLTKATIKSHTKFTEAPRGAAMTGTLQFMALELLFAAENTLPCVHKVYHDLESFVWVILYSYLRKIFSSPSSLLAVPDPDAAHAGMSKIFKETFGHVRLFSIYSNRPPHIFLPTLRLHSFPKPVIRLFSRLFRLVRMSQPNEAGEDEGEDEDEDEDEDEERVVITHEALLKVIDAGIAKISD